MQGTPLGERRDGTAIGAADGGRRPVAVGRAKRRAVEAEVHCVVSPIDFKSLTPATIRSMRCSIPLTLFFGLAVTGCSDSSAAGEPFVVMTLEQALAKAAQDGKAVFVDFGATWCEPCKQLASTTFRDTRVRSWLREKTIPMQIDIDAARDLANEFKVESVPTMVFLAANRSVLGTITGFRDVDSFLTEAEKRLKGITAIAESAAAVASEPGNGTKQFEYFLELRRSGKNDEALRAAEIYWKNSRTDVAQLGFRVSFFLSEMERFAQSYAPARERMATWLEDARTRLLGGEGIASAMELCSLAHGAAKSKLVLEAAAALQKLGDRGHESLKAVATAAGDVLVEARRYETLIDAGVCSLDWLQRVFDMQRQLLAGAKDQREARVFREMFLAQVASPFEALAGVGRDDDAMAVARFVLSGDVAEGASQKLVEAAQRAGRPDLAKLVVNLK
jgi:thioredoxin-related protein